MKKRIAKVLGVLAVVALLATLIPATIAQGGGGPRSQRLLVFTNTTNVGVTNAVAQQAMADGGRLIGVLDGAGGGIVVVSVPDGFRGAQTFGRIPGVLEVFPDLQATLFCHRSGNDPKGCDNPPPEETPTPAPDPSLGETLPWGIDRIDADLVWPTANTGSGVTIVIMDSGVDFDHEDLAGNIASSGHASCVNAVCGSGVGNGGAPTGDHGTHVAGTAAAVDNEIGVIGTANGAKIVSVNVFDGGAYFSDIIAGYEYIAALGSSNVQVVNQSFGWKKADFNGCFSCVSRLQAAVDLVWDAGIVLVASAGNNGKGSGKGDSVGYPARLNHEVAVAATKQNDNGASFSSTGDAVDIAAPGVDVLSTVPGDGYESWAGTSMAAPQVADVAALVIASGITDGSPDAIVARLLSTAEDIGGSSTGVGAGLVDAEAAT